MSSFKMNTKPADGSQNISTNGPENSSSTAKKIEPSTIDHLVTKFETLLNNNFSKYDICIKYQEKFRFRLIKENEDYKYLRARLEAANEDCFRMKSNDDRLIRIYETLLKNNIVKDFVKHGVAKERLNLEFLSTMMQVKNLKKSLTEIDGDISSMKSDYEEMQYREVLMQISPTEESHEYLEFGKKLRLKCVSVMNECECLSKSLIKACEDIGNLKSKHNELTRRYDVLLQDTFIAEFLEYAKNQEKLPFESPQNFETEQQRREQSKKKTNSSLDNFSVPEKIATNDQSNEISSVKILSTFSLPNTKIEFFPSSNSEKGFSELKETEFSEKDVSFDLRLNEYQEKLIAEQRRRQKIEQKYHSLDEFSDKLCRLLLKYQCLMSNGKRTGKFPKNTVSIQNTFVEENSIPFNANLLEKFPSYSVSGICATEMKEENEELDPDRDELHIDVKSNSAFSDSNAVYEFSSSLFLETSAPECKKEYNEKMDTHDNGFHFLISNLEKDNISVNEKKENLDILPDFHSKFHFNNYDSSAKKFDLAASHPDVYEADGLIQKHHSNRTEKHNSIVKHQFLSSSSKTDLRQSAISTLINRKSEQTANRLFNCKICGKTFSSKKNNFAQKCSTCDARNTAIASIKTKSTIIRPTSLKIKSTSVVAENSSIITDFLCDICNRYYSSKANLLTHKRLVHEGLREFECTLCGKMLSTKQSLTLHTTTHSTSKPYKCSICNHRYYHPAYLKKHIRRIHNKKIKLDSNKQPYKSLESGEDVKRRGLCQLQEEKSHEKDQDCDDTLDPERQRSINGAQQMSNTDSNNQKTAMEKNKSRQMEYSSNLQVTDFRCHTCGRYYSHYNSLRLHELMVHQRYKPFKCKSCSRRFTRKYELHRHELTHTSLLPH